MKKIILLGTILFSVVSFAQKLPEGWDAVTLNGKKAYMNLITGAIKTERPTLPVVKPTVKIPLDPNIYHKVEKGDTLLSIASKHGLTVDKLYGLNTGLKENSLQIGQEVRIGFDKSKEGKFAVKEVPDMYTNRSNNSQHFVKKGETLYSISRKHAINVEKLKKLNGLKDNTLSIGQKLKLQE